MCRIASLFLLQRLKGSMSGDAHDFNETWAVITSPPPTRQGAKGNSCHSDRKLGEHAPSYTTVINWVAQFKCGDFSTCDAPRLGWPKTVTTQEIIDQIHKLISEDCWISAKSITQQLDISRKWVRSIIPFFLQNVLHQQRWVILHIDSLTLWKIINEAAAFLILKNRGDNFSSGFLHSVFFGAVWAAMPPFSSGYLHSEFFGAGQAAMPPLHWLMLCLWVIVI